MRTRLLSLGFLITVLSVAHATAQPPYYLALGDSLAIGIQPSGAGVGIDVPTKQGYADDLYLFLRARIPGLQLVKLGCSGETTGSMMTGGICPYPEGSQLAAAENFLQTHRVDLVTIDIGANDVDHCISPVFSLECIEAGTGLVESNLPLILEGLRAASPNTPIVAMNYYDPFLAASLLGPAGQALAEESQLATDQFNGVLQIIYETFSVPVVDVASAFQVDNGTPVPFFNVPLNVFLTVIWTWAAAPAPFGPDIHPNVLGYAVIARAFAEKLGSP
ncbi:MAG TPA: SGNH/GDSL hydrolase family protein [Terriglobales bacterium]|nr:SGNH/GDSL hydrolase family protein [Terriglobales bacterium]